MNQKKCKVCKEKFEPIQFAQNVCNYKCAIMHAKNLKAKKEASEWKVEKAVLKESLKTLGQYETDAKKSFQKWIRLFNEMNCHSQCRKCNRFQNGNELNYRLGLIERYGLEYANNIEDLANQTRQYKFSKEELIAKKIQYEIKFKQDNR
jgi:hypothetical protein